MKKGKDRPGSRSNLSCVRYAVTRRRRVVYARVYACGTKKYRNISDPCFLFFETETPREMKLKSTSDSVPVARPLISYLIFFFFD